MQFALARYSADASSRRHSSGVAPGPPTGVVGASADGSVRVTFLAPVFTGSSPITNYIVTSNPGAHTGSGASLDIIVTGLTNLTSYTFTVTATNSFGTSTASAPSAAVIPKLNFDTWAQVVSGEATWTKLMADCATWADL